MALTATQKQFIAQLDQQAKQILRFGNEEALLMSLCNKKMEKIKDILDSAQDGELDVFCEKYDGFYRYMKLLERMAVGISQGIFDDILKKGK